MAKEIVLTVDLNGEIKIETKGFKGKGCLKESAFLEKVLGNELTSELTPAYFEFDPETQTHAKKYLNICG